MNYPVEIGQTVTVNFPMGGPQQVTVTQLLSAGFLGDNAAGKPVKVRSYKLVEGLRDWVAEQPVIVRPDITGQSVTVASGRGTKVVSVVGQSDAGFTDDAGKLWSWGRYRPDGAVARLPEGLPSDHPVVMQLDKLIDDYHTTRPQSSPPTPTKKPKKSKRGDLTITINGRIISLTKSEDEEWRIHENGIQLFRSYSCPAILDCLLEIQNV